MLEAVTDLAGWVVAAAGMVVPTILAALTAYEILTGLAPAPRVAPLLREASAPGQALFVLLIGSTLILATIGAGALLGAIAR